MNTNHPRPIAAGMAAATSMAQPVPSVLALSNAGTEAELMIYGLIGDMFWDGITAGEVVRALDQLQVDTIKVRINSRGGEVTEGTAIYNALKRHAARIVVVVDGSAESIASVVAMAGDEVIMPANTLMMIHAPCMLQGGNVVQKLKHIETLKSVGAAMAESYIAKTGKREEIEALLADGDDHYFTAAQAIALGLADRTEEFENVDVPATAAAAALCSYLSAIADAPDTFTQGLRQRIQASARPDIFASIPEAMQRAVVAQIEDPEMKRTLETILAAGGSNPSTAKANTTAPAEPSNVPATANTAPPVTAAVTTPAATPAASPIVALRERNSDILALAEPHMADTDIRDYVHGVIAAADENISAGDVGKRILAMLAKGREPLTGNAGVTAGADERDKRRTAMAAAVTARANGSTAEGANEFRGFTMFELARTCAHAAGVNTSGMERMDIVANAFTHSSSDFPLLLTDSAKKALKRGYEEAPEVFPSFTRPVTLTDFKSTSLAGLGRFSNLDEVKENGEYKFGTFNESGSSLQLVTYGKMFGISRQAIINDDLNALSDVPRKMGQAAKRTVGNAVMKILTSNPTLSDGVALFHATHNNLVSSGSVISTTTVDGLRVLMATQEDSDGNTIRVPLKYLVVPVGLGGLARTVLESQFEVSGSKNLTTPNIVRNSFEVIEDPRLDAASSTAWYGVADPNLFDGIVVGYLDGKQEPYIEAKEGWSVDGTQWKVRLDAAAAVADPIGLAKNPGA